MSLSDCIGVLIKPGPISLDHYTPKPSRADRSITEMLHEVLPTGERTKHSISSLENIYFCFHALAQTEVTYPHLEPATWFLVKIQASSVFYYPTVV